MKFAIESNIAFSKILEPITDFSFVLAHLMADRRYQEYYTSLRVRLPNRIIILDNGVHEMRTPIKLKALAQIADTVDATLVIPPDYIRDLKSTLQGTIDALDAFPIERLLPVCQGRTIEECVECGLEYAEMGFERIAVPCSPHLDRTHSLDRLSEDRQIIVQSILAEADNISWVHLLGMCNLFELSYYDEEFENMFSMDTGVPYLHGRNGKRMDQGDLMPKGIPIDFDEGIPLKGNINIEALTVFNMAYMRKIANG